MVRRSGTAAASKRGNRILRPGRHRLSGRGCILAETLHQCGKREITNKQTIWYQIRIFGDDQHVGDLPREETPITEDIRRAYWFYAKVEIARSNVSRRGRRQAAFLFAHCSSGSFAKFAAIRRALSLQGQPGIGVRRCSRS